MRFSLLDGERIVQVLSWHQVQKEHELGEALQQGKDAGLIPEEAVRLCVVCDGAEWIWQHVQALFPQCLSGARLFSLFRVPPQGGQSAIWRRRCQALEWVEATLTRLYMGQVGTVLGGLRRMQPTSDRSAQSD